MTRSHSHPHEGIKGITVENILTIVFDSDDWPTMIMVTTFLDITLEFALNCKFERELSKTQLNELFDGTGPLATFSSKIALAYALGLLTEDQRHDLQIIKTIRNKAAHRISAISFTENEISVLCNQLKLVQPPPREFLDAAKEIAKEKWAKLGLTSPRAKFILSFGSIWMSLLTRSKIGLFSQRLRAAAETIPADLRQNAGEQLLALLGIDPKTLRPIE